MKNVRPSVCWEKRWILRTVLTGAVYVIALRVALPALSFQTPKPVDSAEARALRFLTREVPAWLPQNGCFSCHNNGDGARALYLATRKGKTVPAEVLTATTNWLREPKRWDDNKGDPGFSDKRLANVQFAASLLSAVEAGLVRDVAPVSEAARKLIADQERDGTWKIDAGNTVGSPATWGTPLATWMAWRVLQAANLPEGKSSAQRARQWLQEMKTVNVSAAATWLLAFGTDAAEKDSSKRKACLQLLQRAQTRDGGWGPYADAPPEVFDTALALLALASLGQQTDAAESIKRGRAFLLAQQNDDGSWPATTRPSGGDSYAQMMSTTAWALQALLETQP